MKKKSFMKYFLKNSIEVTILMTEIKHTIKDTFDCGLYAKGYSSEET